MPYYREVIYDDETIIGYSDDIVYDFTVNLNSEDSDELVNELVKRLSELDHELVYIWYHPMGAYTCIKLELKEELFVV